MKIFVGKSEKERKQLIAAIILGTLAVFSLAYVFGGSIIGSKNPATTTVTISVSPTPTPRETVVVLPELITEAGINEEYGTTPVIYNPQAFSAPDAGRNIFAFYEPPPPTPVPPFVPTPIQIETPKPTPTPPLLISFITPQNVFAGAKAFRLEVSGDKFTPDTRIIFNGSELPTFFISPQKLSADIPSNFISGEGVGQIEVRSPTGKLYSNPMMLTVQAPPKPAFTYIGLIARRSYNNDTAYLQETGKPLPTGVRLNDVVGGRFRVVSISPDEIVFEDTGLGFKHRLPMLRPGAGQSTGTGTVSNPRTGFPNPGDGTFVPYPGIPAQPIPGIPGQPIPGIPSNIRPYNPNQPMNQPPRNQKKEEVDPDVDDDDGF